METTKLKFEYAVENGKESGIPVIIVAAGASARMQGINKQLLEIKGVPVIVKTLLAFEKSQCIKNIILVVKESDLYELQILTEKYSITKLTDIVCGGKTRQESVLKGLARIKQTDKNVLIHDGARPFVNEEIISAVAQALNTYDAVTCAVKLKDTIKQVDETGKIIYTLNRNTLIAVQTPQGVNIEKYRKAIETVEDFTAYTDDTSIMEAAGFTAATVNGSYKNIKITTPEDIPLAEIYGEEQ